MGYLHTVIASASVASATWDTPILDNSNGDAYTDPAYPGDIANGWQDTWSNLFSLTAGGRWDKSFFSGTAFICAGYDIALANEYRGARLAYLMSDDVL